MEIYDIRKDLKILADQVIDSYYKLSKENQMELISTLFKFRDKSKRKISDTEKNISYTQQTLFDSMFNEDKKYDFEMNWKKIFQEAQHDKDFKIVTNKQITVDRISGIDVFSVSEKQTECTKPLNISEYFTAQYNLTIKNATKLEEKFISEFLESVGTSKNFIEILSDKIQNCDIRCYQFTINHCGQTHIIITVR